MATFKICRICYQSVSQDTQTINEVHTEILDVLLINLDLSLSDLPVICRTCWEQMQKIFEFKSKCIETEDLLTPFLKEAKITDLFEITKNGLRTENAGNKKVCRLCMNITEEKRKLNSNEQTMFQTFFPEIKLNNNLATIMCSACYDSFQGYFRFATKCLDWENKLQKYVKMVGLRKKRKFCLNNFLQNIDKLQKLEKENSNVVDMEEIFHIESNDSELNIKHEITEVEYSCGRFLKKSNEHEDQVGVKSISKDKNSNGKKQFKCTQCLFESSHKPYMKRHELMHKGIRKEYKKKIEEFKCSVCSFVTNSKNYLIKHELMHKRSGKKFQCPECPLETIYKECLLKHLQTVHNPDAEIFMCNDCDFKTKHKISIIRHVEHHRPKDILVCESCDYQTSFPKKFELHVCKKKKIKRTYPCDICSYVTTKQGSLRQHKWVIHDIGEQVYFKCEICSFFTKTKPILKKHLRAHEKKSKSALYKCPHCEFKTFDTHCLKKHISTHQHGQIIDIKKCIFEKYEVEKKFKCKECDAAFAQKKTLLRHQIVHSEEKPFKCTLCPYKAKNLKNLDTHKVTHRDSIIKCQLCDFKTKTNSRLKLHMIKHAEEPKIHKCNLCPFESKWKVSLNAHMKAFHLGELFSCKKCDFKTPHRRTIINHQLVHGKDKLPLLKCNKCKFTTKRQDSMRSHSLVHKDPSELTMFKCTECSFETKYRRSLRNHIRDVHENQDEQKKMTKNEQETQNFKCSKCPHKASSRGLLNKHIARIHSTKNYNCNKCSYSTHFIHNLTCHQKRMHAEFEILKCNKCEFETRYKRSLLNHISNIHEQWEVSEQNGQKQIKRKNI